MPIYHVYRTAQFKRGERENTYSRMRRIYVNIICENLIRERRDDEKINWKIILRLDKAHAKELINYV